MALESLNPADGFEALSKIKNFPRDRRLEECSDETHVVETIWELTEDEQGALVDILPRAEGITTVEVGRYYMAQRWVNITGLKPTSFDAKAITSLTRKVIPAIAAAVDKIEDASQQEALKSAGTAFETATADTSNGLSWATATTPAVAAVRKACAAADVELAKTGDAALDDIEDKALEISGSEEAEQYARDYIVELLPVFIFLDEYPELDGEQNLANYMARKEQGDNALSDSDHYFEKLCKVAGLRPKELQDLLGKKDTETRSQLANRAGSVVTKEIRRLWRDRELTIRFDLDGPKMNTLVYDPTAPYPVEVNLDERSRGFKWFFSFYITFSADTNGGEAENAILLLDEPGLYLHATSQEDLLRQFRDDFDNQILYTTHSPFMVPTTDLDSVRTVNIAGKIGTTVTNDPTGDAKTLFPLQSALGYNLAQSMFLGGNNLVVEGVTDFWMLSAISDHLASLSKTSLHKDLTLTPAGGAQKVSYMVALLTSEQLNVLVLLDREGQSVATKDELVKNKLIREDNVVFVSEGRGAGDVNEADLEDLLDPDVFVALVKESYAKELKGKTLELNDQIPRIAKRVEEGLKSLGIEFHKTRPARLLLAKMASEPEKIVTAVAAERFERLLETINTRLEKHLARDRGAFN